MSRVEEMRPRRFVLLDRDGTVIANKPYLADPDEVRLLEGAAAGMRRLAALGLGVVIVTNQSAIGRGLLDEPGLEAVHARLIERLASEGVHVDGIFHCPHHPDDACTCRKPESGVVERAVAVFGFDPAQGFVVGDSASDIALGRRLSATTILVRTGHGSETEASGIVCDHVVGDLEAASALIEKLLGSRVW